MSKIILINRCEPWCPYSSRFSADETDHSINSRPACIKRTAYCNSRGHTRWEGSYKQTFEDYTITCFLKEKESSCEE